jgi:hypothetical protein
MITIKEIAPYLPYNVKYMGEYGGISILKKVEFCRPYNKEKKCFTNEIGIDGYLIQYIKLILHPLSDLTKEIEVNGVRFVPGEVLSDLMDEYDLGYNDHYFNYMTGIYEISHPIYEPYFICQELIEWHFDVFSLIERGDAIDINTL